MQTFDEVVEPIRKDEFEVFIKDLKSGEQPFVFVSLMIPHKFLYFVVEFTLIAAQKIFVDECAAMWCGCVSAEGLY